MEVNCKPPTTNGMGKVRCLLWVEVGTGWGFNPLILKVLSKVNSVVIWGNLFGSQLQVIVYWRLFLFCLQEKCDISDLVWDEKIFDYQVSVDSDMDQIFRLVNDMDDNRTHWWEWFLVASTMCGFWVPVNSEGIVNTKQRPQLNRNFREKWKRFSGSRWIKLCVLNQ